MEEGNMFSPSFLSVAVAVNESKSSRDAVKWALERFVPEGRILFKLLHVRTKTTAAYSPTRDDAGAAAHGKEAEWKTKPMVQAYQRMCDARQVQMELVVLEANDVAEAIAQEVTRREVDKLVVGASSSGIFSRKLRTGGRLSSKIADQAPSFCEVYTVSKGRVSSLRASSSSSEAGGGNIGDDRSVSSADSRNYSSDASLFSMSEWTETDSEPPTTLARSYRPLAMQRDQALKVVNQSLYRSTQPSPGSRPRSQDSSFRRSSSRNGPRRREDAGSPSIRLPDLEGAAAPRPASEDEVDVSFALERLRIELGHLQEMCEKAQTETTDVSRELSALSLRRMEEKEKLREISSQEEEARELMRDLKQKREAAEREARYVRECAEREAVQRKDAENDAVRVAEEKQRLEQQLRLGSDWGYRVFEWEEVLAATSSLSDERRIGSGANGTVYVGTLRHMKVAVKVLQSNETHRTRQFKQELEVLGRIRHPHLLLLLGACPDQGCLVYEYMENGSLDDRLQQKRRQGEPPLRWSDRFRIAWEVASALAFLHNARPKPIVHRDLKPANILLDRNLVSKIGDVGLSTLLNCSSSSGGASAPCKETAPVGTLCYIDPEYQRSGVVSLKSDVYALGVVLLQLATGRSPLGLVPAVEAAAEEGRLAEVLDPSAGRWPLEETRELVLLALHCSKLKQVDRPDLQGHVLPVLQRLLKSSVADDDARNSPLRRVPSAPPPSHFFCPILKEVMEDPCVAADGYTYDRRAIEIWLSMNHNSPMTNAPLLSKTLIPNHAILSAINEWKSRDE